MTTLLLVDDDADLRAMLSLALSDAGYSVIGSGDAETALYDLSRHAIDIALVDIRLPGMNGLDLCREVRRRAKTPIVAVSAQAGRDDAVAALEAGADDYVTKPIDLVELSARLRSLLRRTTGALVPSTTVRVGRLLVDVTEDRVERAGDTLPLTSLQARLLATLAERPGVLVRREELLERARGCTPATDLARFDAELDELRAKLESHVESPRVVPVLGEGYRLEP